jgi:hypothetical protein
MLNFYSPAGAEEDGRIASQAMGRGAPDRAAHTVTFRARIDAGIRAEDHEGVGFLLSGQL